jgi:hypothetical protein
LITEALALDLKDRVPSAAEFKRRLARLKNRTAISITSSHNPRPAASEAPTAVTLDARSCVRCAKPIPLDARFCPYCSADCAPASQTPQPQRAVSDSVERRNRCLKALRGLRDAVRELDASWDNATIYKATSQLLEARELTYDLSLGWPEIARDLCAWCDVIHERCQDAEAGYPVGKIRLT